MSARVANREQWSGPKAHHLRGPPVPAPGALALRCVGDTSANGMPATSLRKPANNMARQRTLRRAMVSASAKVVYSGGYDNTRSSETANAPTPPMSAPGALARRLWDNASAYDMLATSSRDQSPPNNMARHRTLRRAVASASAKMPRRLSPLGLTDGKFRDAECADTAYVGAIQPCEALMRRRVRTSYVRNNVAQTFTAEHNGASRNFMTRHVVGVGEAAAKIVCAGGGDKTGSSERQNAPTPPMSAPRGLARRFSGDTSANHMSVASLREHSQPNIMARHRTLRRATPSAET